MLARLKPQHDGLVAIMDRAAPALTGAERTNLLVFGRARWEFVRLLIEHEAFKETSCYGCARSRATASELNRLNALERRGTALRFRIRHHVRSWTADTIIDQWSSYRLAAQSLQRDIRAQIETERRILYPLLDQVTAAAA